jgi:hypothetical protein
MPISTLYHNLINGKSVTGIMPIFNKTLINWFSKKKETSHSQNCHIKFGVCSHTNSLLVETTRRPL